MQLSQEHFFLYILISFYIIIEYYKITKMVCITYSQILIKEHLSSELDKFIGKGKGLTTGCILPIGHILLLPWIQTSLS